MKKTLENAREAIIQNSTTEKILEQSSNLASKLSEKENSIACYLWGLIESQKIGMGYQFGLKRFNSMFIQWENGKATEKASTIPTVKEISNACKSLYKACESFGFFPIVKTNSDGAIIIDCIKWVAEFYSETKPKKASEKKEKPIVLDYDALILGLQELDIETLSELKNEIESILKSRVKLHKKTA